MLKADQLDDLVCSLSALRRLRQLMPRAQLTAVMTAANAALAASYGLFDDVIEVEFHTDSIEHRRLGAANAAARPDGPARLPWPFGQGPLPP